MTAVTTYFSRTVEFLGDVRSEMKKVTWPARDELRRATGVIIVFVLLIGFVIWLMDVVLQGLLVKLIPSIFGAR